MSCAFLELFLSTDNLSEVGDFLISLTYGLRGLELVLISNKKCRLSMLRNDHFWLWYISIAMNCTLCLRESEAIRKYGVVEDYFWYHQTKTFTAHRRLRRQWYSSFSSRVMVCKTSSRTSSKNRIVDGSGATRMNVTNKDIYSLLDQFLYLEGSALTQTRISASIKHQHRCCSTEGMENWEYYWREFRLVVSDSFRPQCAQDAVVEPPSTLVSVLDAAWKSIVSNFVVPEMEKVDFQPFEKRVVIPSSLLSTDFTAETAMKRYNLPWHQWHPVRQMVNKQKEILSLFSDLLQSVGVDWSDLVSAAQSTLSTTTGSTIRWFCCAVPLNPNPYRAQCLCVVVVRFLPLACDNSSEILHMTRLAASSFQRYPPTGRNLHPAAHPLDPLFDF